MSFNIHNVDAEPAIEVGKDEANNRYYIGMSGSISMKEKSGTSTNPKKVTTFKGFTIYSDGDITGTITITKKFDLIPNMVTLTSIKFQHENDNLKCKIVGNVHDLPAPLDELPTTEFSITFDKDGNVEELITPLKELEKGLKGHKLGGNDSTEWDVGIGSIDITYLALYLQYDEGTLNKDHSELRLGLDIYLNLKNQDGSTPTDEEKRISFGEINQNGDFTGGIRVNFNGDFTWHSPTNANIIQNKKLDLAVLQIMINALAVEPDPFSIVFTGSILLDVEGVAGSVSFENLKIGLDGTISNLSDSLTGGSLSVMDVVEVEVDDINWSTEETDLSFKENQTQGDGENQSPQTGQKTVRVESYLQLVGASMSIGDGSGNTVMSGGFAEFAVYKPVDDEWSFVLREAELSISDIYINADISYAGSLLLFAGGIIIPGPEGDIEAIACGKLGVENNKTTMGIFIAAAGLSIPVGPGVFLDEVGGGFFYNPVPADLAMVRRLAKFERPELDDDIESMRPGGADNPGSFALMLLGEVYVSSPDVLNGRALVTLTSNFFNLDAEVELTGGLLEGTAYLAIGWSPAYAEGAVDVEMDYVNIITGNGSLDFYVYGSETWSVMGDYNIALLGMDLATGSVFVGNPGFMLETSVTAGIDLKIVSGSYTIAGMFWYYRTPDPDTFGAYGLVSAEGEFLGGLLGAKASLEGALMAVPSFVFYSVGSVSFKVCYVKVYEGSLWIAVSSHGFDGGKGRNNQYDGYIEEARNMADDLKASRDELAGELDQAKAELVKLSDEQREAAGLALVERSGIIGGLVQISFQYNEIENWSSGLPPELGAVNGFLFGSAQQQLIHTRNEIESLDSQIRSGFSALNTLQPAVAEALVEYNELIVGELPSVQELGTMKNPFRGMQTKTVKDRNGNNITIAVGFEINEQEARSQRDKFNNIRGDFAEYQDEFIRQAGVVDGSLQKLDEILFMNENNLTRLAEIYSDTYTGLSQYTDKYVVFMGENTEFAFNALETIRSSVTVDQIESVMRTKAEELINQGQINKLNRWNQDRISLIQALVSAGGAEGYSIPPELTSTTDPVELFVLTGREIWWEIPMAGFQASYEISPMRRAEAIATFKTNARNFIQKWAAASNALDGIYERKASLYNLLYEIYDELGFYGTGMIGVDDDGNACGFSGIAGAGLGFRLQVVAQSVRAQGYIPEGDVVYPDAPTIGPLRPPVRVKPAGQGYMPKVQPGSRLSSVLTGPDGVSMAQKQHDIRLSSEKTMPARSNLFHLHFDVGPSTPHTMLDQYNLSQLKGALWLSSGFLEPGLLHLDKPEGMYENGGDLVYAQAGEADFYIAQLKTGEAKRAPGTGITGSSSASEPVFGQLQGGFQVLPSGTGGLLPEFSSKINRTILPYIKKRPAVWVSVPIYFREKRNEIEPYLEIPVIQSFTGTVTSRTEFDALLTASINASHPIGIVEYSFKVAPAGVGGSQQYFSVPGNGTDENGKITSENKLGWVKNRSFNGIESEMYAGFNRDLEGSSWYMIPGEMYAGGVQDAGVESQVSVQAADVPAVQFTELVAVEINIPWFSMGKLQNLSTPFFSDVDSPGEYMLYIRVRGAGGYSIERSARVRLEYFNPETDTSPMVNVIDTSDSTPPTTPVINVSSSFTSSTSMLYASWYAHDPESGIQRYEYGVSTYRETGRTFVSGTGQELLSQQGVKPAIEVPGAGDQITQAVSTSVQIEPDVLPWQNAGGRTEANIRGLNLQNNTAYAVHIRATNGAGLSSVGNSQPVLVDTTPPSRPVIKTFEQVSIGQYPNSIHFTCDEGIDEESGIVANFFALGSEPGGSDVFSWTGIESGEGTVLDIPLSSGETVWLTVESYNGAGLKSSTSRELVMNYIDTTPPSEPQVVTMPAGYVADVQTVSVGWNIAFDPESGIVKYEYGLGSNPGFPDILSWRIAERVEEPEFIGEESESPSEAGLAGSAGSRSGSEGWMGFGRDSPPGREVASTGNQSYRMGTGGKISGNDKRSTSSSSRKTGGGSASGGVVIDFSSSLVVGIIAMSGLSTDYVKEISDLQLYPGSDYYCFVRITNGAGLQSVGVSEPIKIDKTPPEVSVTGPETVTLTGGLSFTISANDEYSGIAQFRYAVWKAGEISMKTSREEVVLAYAGVPDFSDGNIILASGRKLPETPVQEPVLEGEPAEGGVPSSQQPLYMDLINSEAPQMPVGEAEISPWSIVESTTPWIDSGWVDTTAGIPPETYERTIKIDNYPKPGLKKGGLYRIRVWVRNGARLESAGVVMMEVVPSKAKPLSIKQETGAKTVPKASKSRLDME